MSSVDVVVITDAKALNKQTNITVEDVVYLIFQAVEDHIKGFKALHIVQV